MYLNKNLMIPLRWFVIATLVAYLSLSVFTPVYLSKGQANGNYTYYGVVPSKIYRYILRDWNASDPTKRWTDINSGWIIGTVSANFLGGSVALNGVTAPNGLQIATKSLLAIVATEDNTNFEVYNLTLNGWLQMYEGHLNSMKKQLMLLANGTTFKVVSDKQVSLLLLNYQIIPSATATEGPVPYTFFTSTDGLYVGKKFVLMASELPGTVIKPQGTGTYYTILAWEKSHVTVTGDDGSTNSFDLDANSYKYYSLSPFRVYTIESTGNIVVQSGDIGGITTSSVSCYPVPAAEGGFVGTHFIARSKKNPEWGWDPGMDYGYRIMAVENAKVTVYNLETEQVMKEYTVTAGTGIAIQPDAYAIRVDSDKPITLSLIHNGSLTETPSGGGGTLSSYGNGVMFVGIRSNQETMIHLPTQAHVEAYFFASSQTQLTIDGTTYTIHAGSSYFYNMPGTHTVKSDNNVILQINFWPLTPEYQGLWYTGAAIPCIETVSNNPNVTLSPVGGGFPMMYVIVGAGAAAVVVVAGVLAMRRRGGKPS